MIYSQNKKLGASLCGADAKLSVIGAVSLVEDSLTECMGELKIDGITAMNTYNAIWLFTKNHVKFLKPVCWKDNVKVESYISVKSAIRLCIDTCIKDGNGEIAVYSRIELCGVDKDTGRIRKIETIGVDESVVCEPVQCDISFFGKEQIETEYCGSVTVKASNIDYVHHTNNVEYVRFIIDTFTFENLLKNPVTELEIHYLNQSFEGDKLDICRHSFTDKTVFEIVKGDTKIIKCEIVQCHSFT